MVSNLFWKVNQNTFNATDISDTTDYLNWNLQILYQSWTPNQWYLGF